MNVKILALLLSVALTGAAEARNDSKFRASAETVAEVQNNGALPPAAGRNFTATFASWKSTFKTMFDPHTVAKSCLARAVYFEARSESQLGQLAVATVILNRARDVNYPSSICGVVYQGASRRNACQFSFACDGQPDLPQIGRSWEAALAVTSRSACHGQAGPGCSQRHPLPCGLCGPGLVPLAAPRDQDRPPHLLHAGLTKAPRVLDRVRASGYACLQHSVEPLMTNLLAMTASRPTRTLADGEVLLVQGEGGGDLFILLSGKLVVVRDGVNIATISQPGTLVGELSVLLGIRNSATVSAEREAKVRVIRDANTLLDSEPGLARRVAALVAGRLDATSALLVELAKQNKGKSRTGPAQPHPLDPLFIVAGRRREVAAKLSGGSWPWTILGLDRKMHAGFWTPKEPVSYGPAFDWPPRPRALLKWFFGFPGYLWPWNVLYAVGRHPDLDVT